MQYVWFNWSIIILVVWLVIYRFKPAFRKVMLKMSLITAPFGLTEPLFVPEYWYPPTLFNMAEKTGFDIESIISELELIFKPEIMERYKAIVVERFPDQKYNFNELRHGAKPS